MGRRPNFGGYDLDRPKAIARFGAELRKRDGRFLRAFTGITHDFDEAIRLADRIAIMKDGAVDQIGTPEDLVEGVYRGVDMFDCVLPTRMARTGSVLTWAGRLVVKNSEYARDERPGPTEQIVPGYAVVDAGGDVLVTATVSIGTLIKRKS